MSALRALDRLFRNARPVVALSLALSIAQALFLIPVALIVRYAFDDFIPDEEVDKLVLWGVVALASYLASAAFGFATRFAALKATKAAIADLRVALLARLYGFRQAFFDREDLGRLHATVVQDTERLDIMANSLVAQVLPAVLGGIALSITLIVFSAKLFFLLVVLVPLIVLTSRLLGVRVRHWTQAYQRSFDTFSSQTGFALRAIYLTKATASEERELEQRRGQFDELSEVSRKMSWLQAAFTLANSAVIGVASMIILVAGGAEVARGTMTMGEFLSFFAALTLMRARISTIFTQAPIIVSGFQSLARLDAILATDEPEPYRGSRSVPFRGSVRLEDVSFAYGEREILRRASLSVEPGEQVALVGPNGAGKSTIVSLVLGLYRPDEGRVLADGELYEDLDLRPLRRGTGVVLQDPLIFQGTIRENIAFGEPDATDADIAEAAERASAAEFIAALPNGYDTDVGAEGVRLSGGQRQRIAIARALVGRPSLVILDEPATYLDTVATRTLVGNLRTLSWSPALLIVGHDEVLLPEVDRVYRLRDGEAEVEELGPVARVEA